MDLGVADLGGGAEGALQGGFGAAYGVAEGYYDGVGGLDYRFGAGGVGDGADFGDFQ